MREAAAHYCCTARHRMKRNVDDCFREAIITHLEKRQRDLSPCAVQYKPCLTWFVKMDDDAE